MTVRLFVSYSHKDEAFRAKLKTHLAALEREGLSVFYDGDITPGKAIDPEIKRNLRTATVFIALASPDYLESRYCFVTEYQYALRRAARGTMHVVVAVLRPCQWKHTRMGHYKSLPFDGKEVTRWANRDAAFEDIVNGLRRVVAEAEAIGLPKAPAKSKLRRRSTAAQPPKRSTASLSKRTSLKEGGERLAKAKTSKRVNSSSVAKAATTKPKRKPTSSKANKHKGPRPK